MPRDIVAAKSLLEAGGLLPAPPSGIRVYRASVECLMLQVHVTGGCDRSHKQCELVDVHRGVTTGVQVFEQFVGSLLVPSTWQEACLGAPSPTVPSAPPHSGPACCHWYQRTGQASMTMAMTVSSCDMLQDEGPRPSGQLAWLRKRPDFSFCLFYRTTRQRFSLIVKRY